VRAGMLSFNKGASAARFWKTVQGIFPLVVQQHRFLKALNCMVTWVL